MAEDIERLRRLTGTAVPAMPHRVLRSGRLEARLEGGNLRYIRFDGHEVLRAVAYVIRDKDWGTYEPSLENLAIEEEPDGFRVRYDGSCRSAEAVLRYQAEIEGHADGRLRFAVTAEPDGDFVTNRCGFTVLHPIEGVAGAPVTVEHVDGLVEDTVFPELIAPWQPFKQIRALTHVAGGHRATCRLEGAAFEMEDHRNWSDASFKTYVRPLELPWPYVMAAGQPDRQSMSLSIEPAATERAVNTAQPGGRSGDRAKVELVIGPPDTAARHPQIGLVVTPDEVGDTLGNLAVLQETGPQAILCHFDPTAGHGPEAFAAFAALQARYPARYLLECVVAGDGDLRDELASVAADVTRAGLELSAVAVCPSVDRQSTPPGSAWPPCPPLEDVYAAARAAFPGLPLGGGMFSYFTELNRKRPPVALLDFVTHATCPIVHAADDDSVMETLEALPHITRSARAIIGGKPYHIGPSTIAMRQNPYGSRTFPNPRGDRICMAEEDPRHCGLYGAAWTIGYAARIAGGAPALHVPAAIVGPRGLATRQPDPDGWRRHPVSHAVRLLAELAGRPALPCRTSEPRRAAALAAETDAGRLAIVANLTAGPIEISLAGPLTRSFSRAEVLDAVSAGWWTADGPSPHDLPRTGAGLRLDAFAVAALRE